MAGNFCEDEEEFMKPIFENGVYKNPFKTWKEPRGWDLFKILKSFMFEDTSGIPGKCQSVCIDEISKHVASKVTLGSVNLTCNGTMHVTTRTTVYKTLFMLKV